MSLTYKKDIYGKDILVNQEGAQAMMGERRPGSMY